MVDSQKSEVQKLQKQIEAIDMVIKKQDKEINALKHTLSEAETFRQKQIKEKDMVLNERDILGNQLIKRREELTNIYEKIRVQESTIKYGNSSYIEN